MAASGVAFRPEEPNVARMYDYMLGGKDNFPADREAARRTFDVLGEDVVRGTVAQNRRFLGRAVRYLARETGIRQFLDIGTGLPTMGSVHEVAREVAPDSRVVYVDNDPVVISHAGYTLHGIEGTAIVDHDLRDPGRHRRRLDGLGAAGQLPGDLAPVGGPLHGGGQGGRRLPGRVVAALPPPAGGGRLAVRRAAAGGSGRCRLDVAVAPGRGHPAGRLTRRGVAVVRDRTEAVTPGAVTPVAVFPGGGGASWPPRTGRPGAGPSRPWRCCC